MDKQSRTYQAYVQILKEELIPAMGCTEPIAIAYAAAKDQSDQNTAVPAAGQAGQHDEHKYNAGGTQQGGCASFV